MPEEKKENNEEQGSTENLQQLNAMVERMEKANAEKKALLAKEENLLITRKSLELMGGQTESIPAPKPKEETPLEYARRISKGKL